VRRATKRFGRGLGRRKSAPGTTSTLEFGAKEKEKERKGGGLGDSMQRMS